MRSDSQSGDPTTVVGDELTGSIDVATQGPAPGSTLGRYVVLERLGQGGMGIVVRGYDPKLQREVALKVLRTDRMTADNEARLIREARAMAKLSHPNVVAVYDVEPHEDTLVLAMEYVAGEDLRRLLRDGQPPRETIIGWFVAAGRGLAAAHAVGLLHRDFKPANVLVGGDGHEVKVTDFGLARVGPMLETPDSGAVSARNDALMTAVGQVMGTPRYMSPEQRGGDPLTPATDQYSFCVSLWEALVGSPPFSDTVDGSGQFDGAPPWPRNANVAAPISEAIRRGLSLKPSDRFPDMAALLQVLERRNDGRGRWIVLPAAAAIVGLVGFGLAPTSAEERCTGAEPKLSEVWGGPQRQQVQDALLGTHAPYAETTWKQTAKTLDEYGAAWMAMHTETCLATAVRGEQSGALMDLRMHCLQGAHADLGAAVDVLADADLEVVSRAHEVVRGLPLLSRCADVEALQSDIPPPNAAIAPAVERARMAISRGHAAGRAGRPKITLEAVAEAFGEMKGIDYDPVRGEILMLQGWALTSGGDYKGADTVLAQAQELAARFGRWDLLLTATRHRIQATGAGLDRTADALMLAPLARGLVLRSGSKVELAKLHGALGHVLKQQGSLSDAEREMREAQRLLTEASGSDSTEVGLLDAQLAGVLLSQGKLDEAESLARAAADVLAETLHPEHPFTIEPRRALAAISSVRGRYAEAEAEQREILAIAESAYGHRHPEAATLHSDIAATLMRTERFDAAATEMRLVVEILTEVGGAEHALTLSNRAGLGGMLYHLGKLDEAKVELEQVIALSMKSHGPDFAGLVAARNNLAMVLESQRDYAAAESEINLALDSAATALDPSSAGVLALRSNAARLMALQGQTERAIAATRSVLEARVERLGRDHRDTHTTALRLAKLLRERDPTAALALVEEAEAAMGDDAPSVVRGQLALQLAKSLWDTGGDKARARTAAASAKEALTHAGTEYATDLAEAEAWLQAQP